jgi:peptide/nickel transport system permease protein
MRALLRSRTGLLGAVLIVIFVAAALLAPWLPVPAPTRPDLLARLSPPSIGWGGLGRHPLGTDQLGRDILSRILFGSQVTLMVAAASVVLGGLVGVALGIMAGYFGGWLDRILMRVVDIQLALPLMLLALLVVAVLGPSLQNIILVLALTCWVRYARIVRGQVLALRDREFILSVRAAGAGPLRIMLHHVLPNVLTPILVVGTLELARVILLEAALSFLGLGVQPPFPSWGRMLSEGRGFMASAWWIAAFPGIAIMLMVLAVNLLGDWLRDHFDPRLGQN